MADQPDHFDSEVAGWLARATPVVDPDFRSQLERRLFNEPRKHSHRRAVFLPGAAAAVGLTVLVLILGLFGAGPLSRSSDEPVRADSDCHTVMVSRAKRVPQLQVAGDGSATIRYVTRRERVPVRTCR